MAAFSGQWQLTESTKARRNTSKVSDATALATRNRLMLSSWNVLEIAPPHRKLQFMRNLNRWMRWQMRKAFHFDLKAQGCDFLEGGATTIPPHPQKSKISLVLDVFTLSEANALTRRKR